jgi:DNA modification methylase
MKIHNLSNLPVIDYRAVKGLQGDLKDLSVTNHDKLLRVLNNRGFTTPLFVWHNAEDDGWYLMDGHQRVKTMVRNDLNDNGNYNVPYALIPGASLKEAKEQLLEITSQYGRITQEGLDAFAFDLDIPNLDINFDALMDFGSGEPEPEVEEDEAPEVDEVSPPVSVLGEVYQLGAHRLMCGDATKREDVDLLMDGAKADMVFTDPPYGVDFQSARRSEKDRFAKLQNDDKIITEWIEPMLAVSNGFVFIWTTWKVLGEWLEVTKPIGKMSNMVIWDKGGGGIGDLTGTFSSDFEVALVFNRGAKITGDRLGSVWSVGKDAPSLYEHPTQKPVGLASMAIKNITVRGQIVLDVFGGSGFTLMACEQLNRVCYMMELDPKYCDVIRKRYAKHIGQEESWQTATPTIVTSPAS